MNFLGQKFHYMRRRKQNLKVKLKTVDVKKNLPLLKVTNDTDFTLTTKISLNSMLSDLYLSISVVLVRSIQVGGVGIASFTPARSFIPFHSLLKYQTCNC